MRILFDDLELDTERRELLRKGEPVALTPKAFGLLALLLRRRPRAVSKAEIREALWPRTIVSESNLTSLAAELRAALADDAREPRWVRTVYGFGYAFCGTAADAGAQPDAGAAPEPFHGPQLVFEGRRVPLREGENLLGRVDGAVVWLESDTASRRHARILVTGPSATISDLESKNGTFVNGRRVAGAVPLADGDEIEAGGARLTFLRSASSDSTRTDAAR